MRYERLGVLVAGVLMVALLAGITAGANPHDGDAKGIEKPNVNKWSTPHGQALSTEQPAGKEVNWILPGQRRLDPAIFGSPDAPLGFEDDIGVPVDDRLTDANGTSYTTTDFPTPHSDNHAPVDGSYRARMVDITPIDGPDSRDHATATIRFTSPDGNHTYRVDLKKVVPVGPDHPFLGGVVVDHLLHGKTGIGTKLQPTQYAYGAFWGVAELHVDGELVRDNQLLHLMVTENVRNEDYELMIDGELPRTGVDTHVILPPVAVTEIGPQPAPVPTGYELPNGGEQPFAHVMFDDTDTEGLPVLE